MSKRKEKVEYIYIRNQQGLDLFSKFKNAWLKVPEEYRDTISDVEDGYISYKRPETDEEMEQREKSEKSTMEILQNRIDEKTLEKLKLWESKHLSRELDTAIYSILDGINDNWTKIETGENTKIMANVPMSDGRFAVVEVLIKARKVNY